MKNKKKRFVLSDGDTTNSYGFRVLTAGIDLERFRANPICLNEHKNSTKDVLGTWTEIEQEGRLLTAVPNFDTGDTEGKEVVRKVNNGTIKGCSIGIKFKYDDIQLIDDVPVIVKCELVEASICAIPSNANSVVLYNQDEQPLTEAEIQELCLSVKAPQNKTKPQKTITMKQLTAHLQLTEGAGEAEILTAVKGIEAKLTASETEKAQLKNELDTLKKEKEDEQKAKLTAELDQAVKDGRLDEAGKEPLMALSYDAAMKVLDSLPKRQSVAGQLQNPEAQLSNFDKMTWEELDKGNHLAKLKTENPDYYKERFRLRFGKEPK